MRRKEKSERLRRLEKKETKKKERAEKHEKEERERENNTGAAQPRSRAWHRLANVPRGPPHPAQRSTRHPSAYQSGPHYQPYPSISLYAPNDPFVNP